MDVLVETGEDVVDCAAREIGIDALRLDVTPHTQAAPAPAREASGEGLRGPAVIHGTRLAQAFDGDADLRRREAAAGEPVSEPSFRQLTAGQQTESGHVRVVGHVASAVGPGSRASYRE